MTETEENNVDLVEGHLVCELQVGVANESLMHVTYQITCIALRIGKNNLCLRMVKQQANQFSACIACCT